MCTERSTSPRGLGDGMVRRALSAGAARVARSRLLAIAVPRAGLTRSAPADRAAGANAKADWILKECRVSNQTAPSESVPGDRGASRLPRGVSWRPHGN
jgi:hypothetical protein